MGNSYVLASIASISALRLNIVAPEDPRKEGGIKFETTVQVATLRELEDAFIEAHSKEFDVHYTPPLTFSAGGSVIQSLDGLMDGTTLRIYKLRGVRSRPATSSSSAPPAPTREADSAGSGRANATETASSSDDTAAAIHNLALGGETTLQAVKALLASSKEQISTSFREPFLPARVLYMLAKPGNSTNICSETTKLLLRLLVLLPLDNEGDRKQAMRLAECGSEHWETLVTRHYSEFPRAAGVLRVAQCNSVLRSKLIQAHFNNQAEWRATWSKTIDVVDDYIGQQFAQNIVFPKLQEQLFKRRTSDAPLSFLFVGPSGTGKTELARRIASVLHRAPIEELNEDGRFVEFKMGNYATEEQFSQWIGVPDGVKGGEGHLTLALKKHPNAVIYLDEIEKARPSAGDRLLAFLDAHGTLQVAKTGEHVKTNKATWILSSNIATEETLAAWNKHLAQGDIRDYDAACTSVEQAIQVPLAKSEMFRRPELRNRLSAIVPFTPFKSSEVEQIVRLQMQKLQRKYAAASGYLYAQINWTPEVIEHFTEVNREETLKKGNLRALIKMVENEVNSALSMALDCEERLCGALAPEGHTCNLVTDRGQFLLDLQKSSIQPAHVVVRYLPATVEEATRACEQTPSRTESNETYISYGPSKPASWNDGASWFSFGATTDGGSDVAQDVAWNYFVHWWTGFTQMVDEKWDVLRKPTVAIAFIAVFYSYGWMYAGAAYAVLYVVEWAFSWARAIWSILPEAMKKVIIMGGRQLGGLVTKHWDITLVLLVFAIALWVKSLIARFFGRRRVEKSEDEEKKNQRLVKLILTTLEARDKRLLEFVLDAIEKRLPQSSVGSHVNQPERNEPLERFEKQKQAEVGRRRLSLPTCLRLYQEVLKREKATVGKQIGAQHAASMIARAWRAHVKS